MALGDKVKKEPETYDGYPEHHTGKPPNPETLAREAKEEQSLEAEIKEYVQKMEKTAHISFHVTGEATDQIDFYGAMEDWANEFDLTITSGNVNIYYTQSKKKDIDHKDLKKAVHPNEGGKDSFKVTAGK